MRRVTQRRQPAKDKHVFGGYAKTRFTHRIVASAAGDSSSSGSAHDGTSVGVSVKDELEEDMEAEETSTPAPFWVLTRKDLEVRSHLTT